MSTVIDAAGRLSPAEYEAFVAEVVSLVKFGENDVITKNAKLPGLRQPGEYEIDVLVRTRLGNKVDFLMIIECKNWARAVDRPVVQKVVQTRDAVAAHRAAIVSPVGFSEEAMGVAKVNGVALWVISNGIWNIVMGATGPSKAACERYARRKAFLSDIEAAVGAHPAPRSSARLVQFEATQPVERPTSWQTAFEHVVTRGSGVTTADNEPGVDPRLALSDLADEYGVALGLPPVPACRS